MERFNLKKLNDVEGKEPFRVEVSNRFAALEDFDTEVEINTSLLLYQFTKRVTNVTVIIIVVYHCYQHHTNCY
jgi:hypothetical protein